MAKSCSTCPSLVKAADTRAIFRRDVGADVCRTTGAILSRPGMDAAADERLKVEKAEPCPHHGKIPIGKPADLVAQVAVGDPRVIRVTKPGTVAHADRAKACNNCVHFIQPHAVKAAYGWNVGMCDVRGRLVFSADFVNTADECETAERGRPREDADGVILLPEYEGGSAAVFVGGRGKGSTGPANIQKHWDIDPREYPTDRPVTPEEAAMHIRAWRRVDDPEGGDPVEMPIFDGFALLGIDPTTIDPEDDPIRRTYGEYRPDLYVDHQGLLYDLARLLIDVEYTPILIGPAGVGKSEIGVVLAYMMDVPAYVLDVDKGTDIFQWVGEGKLNTVIHTDPVTGQESVVNESIFVPGDFTEHYDKPGVIIVNEPNLRQEVYEFLRSAMGVKEVAIKGTDTRIKQGFYTFLLCTQNPSDDPRYVGVEPMNVADIDRAAPVALSLPPENIEREIIIKHCKERDDYDLPPALLDKIMQIAKDIRQSIDNGDLPIAWGIRTQVKVARLTRVFSIHKAYRRAIVDILPEEQGKIIMDSVQTVVES